MGFNPKPLSITVTQLNTFLAVIRGGSVTAAADELVVTQPSVSSALAALGRELGCELFERAGRGIRLTEAGDRVRPVRGRRDRPAGRRPAGCPGGRRRGCAPPTNRRRDDRGGVLRPAADACVLRPASRRRVDPPRRQQPRRARARLAATPSTLRSPVSRPPTTGSSANPFLDNEITCITSAGRSSRRRPPREGGRARRAILAAPRARALERARSTSGSWPTVGSPRRP